MTGTDDPSGVATNTVPTPVPSPTSRRGFLALGAAAAGLAATQSAGAQQVFKPSGPRSPKPSPGIGLPADASLRWTDPVLRLVRRITNGLTPAEIATAKQMGYAAYL